MNEIKQPSYFWRNQAQLAKEFGSDMIDPSQVHDGWSRRNFLGVMGASAALAGVGLNGCIRKPVEHIVPYAKRPEDLIPGKPVYYATAFALGSHVTRLVVESQDGRPTKIEGLPDSPGAHAPTDAWTQASILGLYDPERSGNPAQVTDGKKSDISWDDAYKAYDAALAASRAKQGKGLAFVVNTVMSPTLARTLSSMPGAARIYMADPSYPHNRLQGAEMVAGKGSISRVNLRKANIIAAFDSDFLLSDGDWLENAQGFAAGRRKINSGEVMNRLYAIEPILTLTGANADHRIRVQGSRVGSVLQAVAARLGKKISLPTGGPAFSDASFDADTEGVINALVSDLASPANQGRAVIVVGERQPAWVHALGHFVNDAVTASRDGLVRWVNHSFLTVHKLSQLAIELENGAVDTIVVMGSNPVYTATGDLGFADAYKKAAHRFHLGTHFDETAAASTLHLPVSHYLEEWGDLRGLDGTTSIVQPLIAPLFHTPSLLEMAARAKDGQAHAGRSLVASTHRGSEASWKKWLFTGRVDSRGNRPIRGARNWGKLKGALGTDPGETSGFELNFHIDPSVFDGRFATNGWLQELPDPITKLTWDNAALLSRKTARANNLKNGDMLTVTWEGRSLALPAWIVPGTADNTLGLALGYGRSTMGTVAKDAGFNTSTLQRSAGAKSPWIGSGATIAKTGDTYPMATVQHHDSLTPLPLEKPGTGPGTNRRPLIRVADKDAFNAKPDFVRDAELIKDRHKLRSLSTRPQDQPTVYQGKQQWGMTIDLNTCTGCNACMIACQAENNVSVVGKEQVINGREMSWIRLDRYFEGHGDDPNPQIVVQPIACMHCENAPCETVCPVAATTHSPEGLNDMAYNRCIGTRYCANNCPYKVRRFNFFNYNTDIHPMHQMQKNPDVTIRFRGVMEKCTYCVQRISEAKIDAKVRGTGDVPDIDQVVAGSAKSKTVLTACQQVCPSGAIVFGDINNANSRISKIRKEPRRYELLAELNNHPRTSYLAKIRNPRKVLAPNAEKKG